MLATSAAEFESRATSTLELCCAPFSEGDRRQTGHLVTSGVNESVSGYWSRGLGSIPRLSNTFDEEGTNTMTTEMTAPVAKDVTDDLQLIAETPEEMQIAQSSMKQWCASKIAIMESDAQEIVDSVRVAEKNGWHTVVLKRQLKLAEKRIAFYQKIQCAVDAGYCIVPNFPVQIFAIRTTKALPERGTTTWPDDFPQSSDNPPLGIGEYKDSIPMQDSEKVFTHRDDKGVAQYKTVHFATEFDDEIDFPISVAKPLIMSSTARAMGLKCFDEIGVLPNRRVIKQDPLVIGRIKDPRSTKYNERWVSFLIAWYIDTSVL